MGLPVPPRGTHEAEPAAGAVNSDRPRGRPTGPTHRPLWRQHGCDIELLFKRAKQISGWGRSSGRRGDRILVELYAKLLGLLVQHWATLLRGGPVDGVSPTKLFRVVQEFAHRLADGLTRGRDDLADALNRLLRHFQRVRPQPTRTKKPSTRQLLLKPRLAA